MSRTLGQPVIVENRLGAGGNVGAAMVAKSAPDGYTLLSGSSSVPLAPSLFKNLSYDPMKDFSPVALIGQSPMILTVHPDFAPRTVAELITAAKARPGAIDYASAGPGSMNHLAMELFKARTGTDLRHIPYRGNPLAAVDVISGRVPVFMDYVLTGVPNVRSGKLVALAATSASRLPQLPDLPTVAEAGVPGFESSLWFAFFAPAGTLPQVVARLSDATRKALAEPRVKERFAQLGIEPMDGGPAELARLMTADHDRWKAVVEFANIKLE
jgi:tripartite-type tricarboxylate transporter receptor subunit TctC